MWQKLKVLAGKIVMALLVALFVVAFAQTLPIDFAMFVAVDMALYVDALIGVYVIASVTKLRVAAAYYRLRLLDKVRRFSNRAKRIAVRVAKDLKQPANDDDPAWVMAA